MCVIFTHPGNQFCADFCLFSQTSRHTEMLSIAELLYVSYTLQKEEGIIPGTGFSSCVKITHFMCWSRRAQFCANRNQFSVTLIKHVV